MDKLEASLKVIDICASTQIKAAYMAGVVFDSRRMLRDGILNTITQLSEIVTELERGFE